MNNNILQCSEKKYSRYKITKPIRLIELFAGIGAQAKALENLHANFEHYKACEFDKYALASYNAIHNTDFKVSDITQLHASDLEIVDTDKYEYILTYSFPCQSLSLAGKQEGMEENSNTASSLLWEVKRILSECKELPQILLMENVPQVHSKKNIDNFEKWQNFLTSLGYKNYWQDLNAKDYGIPQNRNRCFMISILNSEGIYSFPKKEELKLRLKDMLEEEVEEKYYLSDRMIDYIVANNEKWTGNNNKSLVNKSIASTINTNEGNRRCDASNYIVKGLPENIDLKCIGSLKGSGLPWDKMYNQLCKVYNPDGCSPTIDTMQGGNRQPKIIVAGKTKSGGARSLILDEEGICNCLLATDYKQPKQIFIREKSLFTETQAKMINENGDVKRYINSNIVDKFNEGQCADISFPNGYNKACRVHDECPAINATTTQSSFVVKIKDKVGNEIPLYTNYKKLVETVEKNEMPVDEVKHMDLYNRNLTDNCGTLTDPCHNNNRLWDGLRIRKLTPKECFRLMGFSDEDFDKASLKKEISYIQGDIKCNAKLKIVNEKQRLLDTETYVLCTTNDTLDMETPTQIKWKKNIKEENNESVQNVNIAIEMLGDMEQKECVTNIIKCGENTTTLYTLMEELDQHHMAIIELEKTGNKNTGKYMKIISEENLNPMKLYTISTLIEQIIKSKIYTCITRRANIQGNIAIIEDCKKNLKMMKLSNLKMEYITKLNSSTMLYKQAGNSIVVNVLMAIFKELL